MSQPWLKFYPRDWRGDQALRAVSVAARGMWIECLCIMHEASPYGHLVVNGAPVEVSTLARMTGATEEEATAMLAELSRSGVSSVTRRGVIFSRRMVNDFARAQKGRKAVEKRYSQSNENAGESDVPNRAPTASPITQKPEARSKKEKKPKGASAPVGLFDEIPDWVPREPWEAFVELRKKQRSPLTARATKLALDELLGLKNQGFDPTAIIHQSVLRGWKTFYPLKGTVPVAVSNGPAAAPGFVQQPGESHQHFVVRRFKQTGLWLSPDGARPDSVDCRLPENILIEFGYRKNVSHETGEAA